MKQQKGLKRCASRYPNKILKLSLPMPPSINHMYINTKNGGKKLTKKAERYIRDARALANLAIEEQLWIKENAPVWYYLDIYFYMPDRRIRDSHNTIKILMDALQGSIYINDYYCMPRIQDVDYDPANPRIEIICRAKREK